MMKTVGSLFFTSILFLVVFTTGHANELEPKDEEFTQSLISSDHGLVKVITILMASDQVLSCNLDMTLLGRSYRQFYDLSQQYIDREDNHMDKFVEATELLINSEEFRVHIKTTKTCEELLSIYGEVLQQVAKSSERISAGTKQ